MKRVLWMLSVMALIAIGAQPASAQYPMAGGYPAPGGQGMPGMMPGGGYPGGIMPVGAAVESNPYAYGAFSAEMMEAEVKVRKYQRKYGWNPILRGLFSKGDGCGAGCDKGCDGSSACKDGCGKLCGLFGLIGCGGCKHCLPKGYGAAPPAEGGTLVFPHHPFVRSPRDYFMYEQP